VGSILSEFWRPVKTSSWRERREEEISLRKKEEGGRRGRRRRKEEEENYQLFDFSVSLTC